MDKGDAEYWIGFTMPAVYSILGGSTVSDLSSQDGNPVPFIIAAGIGAVRGIIDDEYDNDTSLRGLYGAWTSGLFIGTSICLLEKMDLVTVDGMNINGNEGFGLAGIALAVGYTTLLYGASKFSESLTNHFK